MITIELVNFMNIDRPLNIVLYLVSYFPTVGGREMVVHYMAKWLKRLGHNPRVVGPAGFISDRKYKFEYPVHRWPTLRGEFVDQVAKTTLYLDAKIWKADIIHAHSTYPNAYHASLVKSLKLVPLVVTPHGEDIHIIPEINFGLRMDPDLDHKIRQAVGSADMCTSISKDVTQSLINAGAQSDKIIEIPNGIDLERFDFDHGINIREYYNIPPDSQILTAVASYHVKRGYEDLINAFSIVNNKNKNTYLLIAGINTDVLNGQILQLGLQNNVILAGQIQPPFVSGKADLLASIYKQSDVFFNASMASGAEGLSLALLDAMGARLPVIATNISGNKDVVIDEKNGYLVEPGDHVNMAEMAIKLLSNQSKIEQFGNESRNIAEQYSWERITKRYLDVYLELIKSKN